MATSTKIAAARAADRLTKALIDTAALGLRHNCGDPETAHMWLSESETERAQAARLCNGCPVSLECWGAAVARDEKFGVWSGIDRTQHPNGRAKASA
jgi:hypothetical protein